MKNLKKYLIWFIIWISCVNAYTFATETNNWTIWELFEYVTDSWKLKANTVWTTQISNLAVTLSKLATNSIDTTKIIDWSILNSDLANNSVSLSKIANNSIDTTKIIDWSINTLDLANASVTNEKLWIASVDSSKILNWSISSIDLWNLVVTSWKLAENSVISSKIKDWSISTSDLANNSITSSKISNNSIDSFKIINESILWSDLADGSITSNKIAWNSVDSSKIVNDAISTDKILNWSITQEDLEPSIIEKLNRENLQIVMCKNDFWVRWIKWTMQKNDISNNYIMRYVTTWKSDPTDLYNKSCWEWFNLNNDTFRSCVWWVVWSQWNASCGNPKNLPDTITYNSMTYTLLEKSDMSWCGKWWSDGSRWKYVVKDNSAYIFDKDCDISL